MDALKILADHHKEWVKIVRSFGEQDLAEDVVQDVYLRIVKYNYEEKIIKDGKPNIALMWMMLRNRAFEINKTGSVQFLSLDEVRGVADVDCELEKHEALERLHIRIHEEMDNWHWYDSMLFKVYKEGNASMRDIAKDSGISLTSIFNTLKNCKERLKEEVGEDYTDFTNQDFDLI
jgi:DNA-directed RNA polymerase specialized sigma24 family protein